MASKAEADEKRIKIDEACLVSERYTLSAMLSSNAERRMWDNSHYVLQERRMTFDEKRLDLNRRRMEPEADERRAQIEKHTYVLYVLAAMVYKLK